MDNLELGVVLLLKLRVTFMHMHVRAQRVFSNVYWSCEFVKDYSQLRNV